MTRFRLKTIFFSFTIILTLFIIGSYALWSHLQMDVSSRLKEKSFLAPTMYFAQAATFQKGSLVNFSVLKEELLSKGYRERSPDQHLSAGDFWASPTQFSWIKSHSEFIESITIDSEGKILSVTVNNVEALTASFEAPLIAQYIGNEPILRIQRDLSQFPTSCLYAVMSIEDQKFLDHSGFSWSGLLRAALKNMTSGRTAQGGSTITQQLVKNYFLTSERTLKRKILELGLSIILETQLSKDEILETYLNIIYMGQNGPFRVHGFGAASLFYFKKEVGDLTPGQCATLAAIVNNPGGLNPWKKSEALIKRRNLVLTKMVEQKYISNQEASALSSLPSGATPISDFPAETAPYYLDSVRKQAADMGISIAGKKIFTGLIIKNQAAAQKAIQTHLNNLEDKNPFTIKQKSKGLSLEGALISADSHTGLISAAVGGRGFRKSQFNRIWDSRRQVGSIMKPIVFLTGLSAGLITPTSLLDDTKFQTKYDKKVWSPDNYDDKYFGQVPAYFALKNSLNSATVSLGMKVGLSEIIQTAKALGVRSELSPVPSITLGSFELSMPEVLRAYVTLSNGGTRPEISFISKITNEKNEVLFEHSPNEIVAVDQDATAMLVGMMKQTIESGTAKAVRALGFTYPAAGKTGTTNENKDVWFGGFTPHVTTIVWVGYDQNQTTKLTGGSGAVPIWTEYMKSVATDWPPDDFPLTPNTEIRKISDGEINPSEIELVFKKGM